MIKGYILTYKPKDSYCRALLNHRLFGRLVYKKTRSSKVANYSKGMLNDTKFYRIIGSKVFILDLKDIDLEEIGLYCEYNINEEYRNESDILLLTGLEYWEKTAREKGVKFINGKH